MWCVVLTVFLALMRARLGLPFSTWQVIHSWLGVVIVISTVIHALQIDGTMGQVSKLMLCLCAMAATAVAVLHLRVVKPASRRR